MFLKVSQVSQESIFNKVAVLRACNFTKKDSDTGALIVLFELTRLIEFQNKANIELTGF